MMKNIFMAEHLFVDLFNTAWVSVLSIVLVTTISLLIGIASLSKTGF
ncbi:hypothetical protein BTN50_1910 [Candidatus Enterovibrio altilux]|uniref:Uncharacterized protein n=1 Tax=Candidatus Enterovibrio altilux TaxID=1927128 RepID=A0A291BBF0_9GAMM|nr:hypothetical protein BTN50_1910 [Candidatus Enterovibrio luxaltus]